MFKYILPFLLLFCFLSTGLREQSVQHSVLNVLKNNDSKSLVKHFNKSVNLALKGEERILTKFQSELLLSEFFRNNRITAIKAISSGRNKQSSTYVVYAIQTEKENLQVVVKFMEIKGETSIMEFKVY